MISLLITAGLVRRRIGMVVIHNIVAIISALGRVNNEGGHSTTNSRPHAALRRDRRIGFAVAGVVAESSE